MQLHDLQHHLASLYETPITYDIYDFLITDARLARALDGGVEHPNRERLLLRESDGDLDLSLYIDESVVDALRVATPGSAVSGASFNAFMTALEGVSHFNYVIWNAHHRRQVTQLELELQAEVDKFVAATMVFEDQATKQNYKDIHRVLFDEAQFLPFNDPSIEQRYRDANRYAGQYCHQLQNRYPAQHRQGEFVNELRRFYRLGQNAKIRVIRHH